MTRERPPEHQDLNPEQFTAVTQLGGPLLILAGPGSGKTRVIAHRIAFLVGEQGVAPWRIVAVTFTNKAAREMRDRVDALLGESAQGMLLGTFHGICARMLRTDGLAVNVQRDFQIYAVADQEAVVRQCLDELNIDPHNFTPRTMLSAVSRAKNEGLDVEAHRVRAGNYFEEVVARVYERYQARLIANQALDFDDLLSKALELFQTQPAVADRYHHRITHVLVDEFQDTNVVQYQLARAWAAGTDNLTVVGDPDQSIYSWRAADIRNILNFERDYPQALIVRLEQNYRSTKSILRIADAVIAPAQERLHKSLWTENPEGSLPVLYEAYSEQDEAEFVVREITAKVKAGAWRHADIAVMYRTNAQSRVLEEALLRRGVPYRLIGGTRFYERREIRDLIAYLRLVHNPADRIAWARAINVPARGLGQKSRALLLDWADQAGLGPFDAGAALGHPDGPVLSARATRSAQRFDQIIRSARAALSTSVEAALDQLLKDTDYHDFLYAQSDDADDRWQNVQELRTVAAEYDALAPDAALPTFLEDVALISDQDSMADEPPSAVTLVTLHTAKGLEFSVVFLTGLEEGVLPHQRSFDDPDSMEEERRLCYVGVTRAQRQLYLVHAFRRALAGSSGHNPTSRFLRDIPDDALTQRGRKINVPSPDVRPARNRWLTRDEFAAVDTAPLVVTLHEGDAVRHDAFGVGVVVSTRPRGDDHEVTVDFEDAGVKKLLLSLAPLERV